MAVIVLTSAPGSPGVTTMALALSLTWPRDVLLADCDREPSQAVLAGYLRGLDAGGRGLSSVAQLHREGRSLQEELLRQSVPLTEGEDTKRRYLPGFSHPAAVRLFDGVWHGLGEAFEMLDSQGVDVIIDAGRVGSNGLPGGLCIAADLVLLVSRSTLRSLAATKLHLPILKEQVAGLATETPLGMMIVAPTKPYSSEEIAKLFQIPVWSEIPNNSRAAEVLLEGSAEPRRFREQLFMATVRGQAKSLHERLEKHRSQREAVLAHA